jgi:hypothetical protein
MLDFSPQAHFHYHSNKGNSNPPIETVVGNGLGWTKEVNGNVTVKAVPGRTTLRLSGPGAMKVNGGLTIGG